MGTCSQDVSRFRSSSLAEQLARAHCRCGGEAEKQWASARSWVLGTASPHCARRGKCRERGPANPARESVSLLLKARLPVASRSLWLRLSRQHGRRQSVVSRLTSRLKSRQSAALCTSHRQCMRRARLRKDNQRNSQKVEGASQKAAQSGGRRVHHVGRHG